MCFKHFSEKMHLCSRNKCKLSYSCATVITIFVNSVFATYNYSNVTSQLLRHNQDYAQIDVKKTDKTRLREPKFISFETRDNNIEVSQHNIYIVFYKIQVIIT